MLYLPVIYFAITTMENNNMSITAQAVFRLLVQSKSKGLLRLLQD